MTTASHPIEAGSESTPKWKNPVFSLFFFWVFSASVIAVILYFSHTATVHREKWRDAYVATILLQTSITGCLENHQGRVDACDSFEKLGTTEWKNSGLDNVNVMFIPNSVHLLLTLKNDENDECQVAATRQVRDGRPVWRATVVGGSIKATFNDFARGDWLAKVPCDYSHTGFDPGIFPTPIQHPKDEVRKEWVCPNKNADDCRFLPIKELI